MLVPGLNSADVAAGPKYTPLLISKPLGRKFVRAACSFIFFLFFLFFLFFPLRIRGSTCRLALQRASLLSLSHTVPYPIYSALRKPHQKNPHLSSAFHRIPARSR